MKTALTCFILTVTPTIIYGAFQQVWTVQESGTTHLLHDVTFVDKDHGWAVGRAGTIIYTTNGGENWGPQTSHTIVPLHSVSFVDRSLGWVAGGRDSAGLNTVIRTTNGGATWTSQTTGIEGDLFACYFVNEDSGWVVGARGIVLFTSDGGLTWSLQHEENGVLFFEVEAVSSEELYLAGSIVRFPGESLILHTVDGGHSWERLAEGTMEGLQGVVFADSQLLWGVGWLGGVIHSEDGGNTWVRQETGRSEEVLFSSSFPWKQTGWVVGGESGCGALNCDSLHGEKSLIMLTTNGGDQWTVYPDPGSGPVLTRVFFVSPDTGWIVGGNGTVMRTTASRSVHPDIVAGLSSASEFVIPSEGGSFEFTIQVDNMIDVEVEIDVWLTAISLNGEETLEFGPFRRTLPSLGSIRSTHRRREPAGDPAGEYRLVLSVGEYPDVVFDTDTLHYVRVGELDSPQGEWFHLDANYPNPFNPSTTIRYHVADQAHVSVTVHNVAGILVSTLVEGVQTSGTRRVVWDGTNEAGDQVASGVYLYRVVVDGKAVTRKMLLVK